MIADSNNLITQRVAIWLGVSGVIGSLVLFAGDMLFYYNGDQADFIVNMASSSPQRIISSGICALVSAWLYTLASGQIYYAFQPVRKAIRLIVFFAFAAIMITYGVVHGAYVAIATSAINASELGMDPNLLVGLATEVNDALRTLAYLPFAVFTILFISTVWTKHTHYPRWIILFSPVVPFLLSDLIVGNLEGKVKVIITGGYLNLILLLFFTASTIALSLSNHKTNTT